MKKVLFSVCSMLIGFYCAAQFEEPVSWSFSAKKIDAQTYEIQISAVVEYGWHIYSQSTPEGGPVPTIITFNKNPLIFLQGEVKEVGKLEQIFEPLFGVNVKQFSNKVSFLQTVRCKTAAKTALSGKVEFMSCNEEMCLPPMEKKFSILIQ